MALSHRTERVAEQIREEVGQILSTEVADPGIGLVTVSRVKVTPDLSLARIYWTIIGDDAERRKTQKALGRAAAYVRHLLSTRMSLRRSPEVQFVYDRSVAAQERVEEILQQIKQEEAAREASASDTSDATRDAGAAEDSDASTPDAGEVAIASASARSESPASSGETSPKRPDGRGGGPDAAASSGIESTANADGTAPSFDQRPTDPNNVEGPKRPEGGEDRPDRD